MDEKIQEVEVLKVEDVVEDDIVDEYKTMIGRVLRGVVGGAGVGIAVLAIKNKDKIKAKFESMKEDAKAKKIEKHLAALEKLGVKIPEESKSKKN